MAMLRWPTVWRGRESKPCKWSPGSSCESSLSCTYVHLWKPLFCSLKAVEPEGKLHPSSTCYNKSHKHASAPQLLRIAKTLVTWIDSTRVCLVPICYHHLVRYVGLFRSLFMFSNFYWLDVHNQTCVAFANLWWDICKKLDWGIGPPLV